MGGMPGILGNVCVLCIAPGWQVRLSAGVQCRLYQGGAVQGRVCLVLQSYRIPSKPDHGVLSSYLMSEPGQVDQQPCPWWYCHDLFGQCIYVFISLDTGMSCYQVYSNGHSVGAEGQCRVMNFMCSFLSLSPTQAGGSGNSSLVVYEYLDVSLVQASVSYVFLVGEDVFMDGPDFGIKDLHHVAQRVMMSMPGSFWMLWVPAIASFERYGKFHPVVKNSIAKQRHSINRGMAFCIIPSLGTACSNM